LTNFKQKLFYHKISNNSGYKNYVIGYQRGGKLHLAGHSCMVGILTVCIVNTCKFHSQLVIQTTKIVEFNDRYSWYFS